MTIEFNGLANGSFNGDFCDHCEVINGTIFALTLQQHLENLCVWNYVDADIDITVNIGSLPTPNIEVILHFNSIPVTCPFANDIIYLHQQTDPYDCFNFSSLSIPFDVDESIDGGCDGSSSTAHLSS